MAENFIKKQSLANLTTMSSIQNFEFEDKKGIVYSKRVVVGFTTQCAIQSAEVSNEAEEYVNMIENTIVAQRIICDAMSGQNCFSTTITQEMMRYHRAARSKYQQ